MRIRLRILLLFFGTALAGALPIKAQAPRAGAAAGPRQPKLVVAIMIDQFRYDYLTRFRGEFTGGLKRLMDEGANFTSARYRHFPTVTAPGHATILTGATPAATGIIENEWWDRASSATVTSVSDAQTRLLGGQGAGSSPRRLLQSTVGDELRASGKGGKMIGVSAKDGAAILPAGHSADAAYWFNYTTGNFVSSTYYFDALPAWVEEFNRARPADKYAGREWLKHKMPTTTGRTLYDELDTAPYTNELLQQFALRALAAEKLGTGAKIDLLAISYSGNDTVGHEYGPDSEEVHDMALRVDGLIGDLLRAAEAQAGPGNVLAVLSADHGVAPVPEENAKRKMPGGRVDMAQVRTMLEQALETKFGGKKWLSYAAGSAIYLNPATLETSRASAADVENVAANALRAFPRVFRVYTREQLLNAGAPGDEFGAGVRNGFNAARSPDLIVLFDPFWIVRRAAGTTHGTLFDYDTHVPLLFWGPGIKPGRYHQSVAPNDVAPTLADLLGIATPSGNSGRVLTELLK